MADSCGSLAVTMWHMDGSRYAMVAVASKALPPLPNILAADKGRKISMQDNHCCMYITDLRSFSAIVDLRFKYETCSIMASTSLPDDSTGAVKIRNSDGGTHVSQALTISASQEMGKLRNRSLGHKVVWAETHRTSQKGKNHRKEQELVQWV